MDEVGSGVQVHLLVRLATVLDLLHVHGKRIHGNLTPRHVLVDTHQSPQSFTIVDFSCSRAIGGVQPRCLLPCIHNQCACCCASTAVL